MTYIRKEYDQNALDFMLSKFSDAIYQKGRGYYATCPECGHKKKLWFYDKMPHQGKCHANCGFRFNSVFQLGYRSEFKKVEKDGLTPLERQISRYWHNTNKKHRLSQKVIKEFNIEISTRQSKDKTKWYDVISISSDDTLGYTKYLNYSGRWISVNATERSNKNKWLNLDKILPDCKQNDEFTVFMLAGEWDMFAFWEHTGLHGISPIDGEGSPAKFGREHFDFCHNRHVVIFWDNDNPGYVGGRALAKTIKLHQKVKSLKVVDLQRLGLSGGEDIDDYFLKGGTKERLFEEIEKTPDFSGHIIDTGIEIARIKNKNKMPEYPDSILPQEILKKLWDIAVLPSAKKDILLEELANINGVVKKGLGDEISKYKKEINTLIYKAFDIEIDKLIKELHIKQSVKNSEMESTRYYYYDANEGYYKFITDEFIITVANKIAVSLCSPDERRKLSEFRNLAIQDFKIKIIDSDKIDFNNIEVKYINFKNGAYNLELNKLLKHSPDYLITYRLPINYEENNNCPNFERALNMSFRDNTERNEILKTMYYIMSGIRDQKLTFWFYGSGDNGKSVFLNLLSSLIGSERTTALPFEQIDSAHGTSVLFGSMLNIIEEVPKGFKIPDAMFKRLTGDSLMFINPKGKQPFSFRNKSAIVIALNELVYSNDTTQGMNTRLKFFKFNRIKKDEIIKGFIKLLEKELPAIAYKLLTIGRKLYEEEGFIETENSIKTKNEMLDKNTVMNYWSSTLRFATERANEVYNQNYKEFSKDGLFNEKHSDHKAREIEKNEVWYYSGEIDGIEEYNIIQRYTHKIKGEIYIVNTNRHYAFYKESLKHDESIPVSYANFRKSTADFIMHNFENIFEDFCIIDIMKRDAMTNSDKKKNIGLLQLFKVVKAGDTK